MFLFLVSTATDAETVLSENMRIGNYLRLDVIKLFARISSEDSPLNVQVSGNVRPPIRRLLY